MFEEKGDYKSDDGDQSCRSSCKIALFRIATTSLECLLASG